MFARTARLTLRPGWPEDAPALAAAIGHHEVATMLSRVPFPYAEADARAWLADEPRRPDAAWLVLSHEDGHGHEQPALVGAVALGPSPHGSEQQIGYWLAPSAWGRGYATEAGRAVVDTARHTLGLSRLTATCWHHNPASARVLDKLGFRQTGEAQMPCRALGGEVLPCTTHALDLRERPALAAAA